MCLMVACIYTVHAVLPQACPVRAQLQWDMQSTYLLRSSGKCWFLIVDPLVVCRCLCFLLTFVLPWCRELAMATKLNSMAKRSIAKTWQMYLVHMLPDLPISCLLLHVTPTSCSVPGRMPWLQVWSVPVSSRVHPSGITSFTDELAHL